MSLNLNLGRIMPKKVTWTTAQDFEVLDFTEYGGSYYTCVANHTSSVANKPGTSTAHWQLVAAGLNFLGGWQNQEYAPNSVVTYGGSAYVNTAVVAAGTGAPDTYTAGWSRIAAGIGVYIGAYNSASSYNVGDVVIYRGSTHRANQAVLSTESPTSATAKWDLISFGFNGPTVSTLTAGAAQAYEIGDVVIFRNSLYIVLANLNSSSSNPQIDSSNYTTLIEAEHHVGNWTASTTYYPRDVVTYGNATWKCTAYAVSQSNPRVATAFWNKLTSGIGGRGAWSASSVDYFIGDVVNHNNSGYLCILDHTSSDSQRPTNSAQTAWELIAGGFKFEGNWAQGAYDTGSVVVYNQSSWVATRTVLANETDTPNLSTGFSEMVRGYPDTSAITYAIALG